MGEMFQLQPRVTIFVILAVVYPLLRQAEACSCIDDWASTYHKRIGAFKNPPVPGEYEYLGVLVGPGDSYFLPCTCTDVLRIHMTMTITSQELFTLQASNTTAAELNVTDTIKDVYPVLEGDTPVLEHRLRSVDATYKSKTSPDKTVFQLDIILRGANDTLVDKLKNTLAARTIAEYSSFTLTNVNHDVCQGTPADSTNPDITKEWNNEVVPPTEAIYKCPAGQYVMPLNAGKVVCQHSSLTWSTLPALTCASGCGDDPPSPPMYSENDWDNSTRTINTIVHYKCLFGFRSGDGKDASSKCQADGTWEKLSQTYFCKEKPCEDPIPQTPAHAVHSFVGKNDAGTVVTYLCEKGYAPVDKKKKDVSCQLGSWGSLPATWRCINLQSLSLSEIVLGDIDLPLSQLTEEEKTRRAKLLTDQNLFFIVTVPSIIGLILFMVACLCCTRLNSPLFYLCRGFSNKPKGYHDHLNNYRNMSCN